MNSRAKPCAMQPAGMTLRVALVGGPMYDGLYAMLDGHDVEVVVHADHPTLNRAVAERLATRRAARRASRRTRSTRRRRRLAAPARRPARRRRARALAPAAVERCRFDGALLAVPRNIDVRVLWANRRLLRRAPVPATWAALRDIAAVVRLSRAASRACSAPSSRSSPRTAGACSTTRCARRCERAGARRRRHCWSRWRGRAPAELPDWHYDQVDDALGAGRVALAAAWPGATDALLRARARPRSRAAPRTSPDRAACAPTRAATPGRSRAPAATSTRARAPARRLCAPPRRTSSRRRAARCARDVDVFAAVRPRDARRRAAPRDHARHDRRRHDHLPAARALSRGRGRRLDGDPRRAARRARPRRGAGAHAGGSRRWRPSAATVRPQWSAVAA